MKIAWVLPRYLPDAPAGAEWTAHEFLKYMVGRGHQAHALVVGDEAKPQRLYDLEGVHVTHLTAIRDCFASNLDVVIGHLGYSDLARDVCGPDTLRVWMAHAEYQYQWSGALMPDLYLANSKHVRDAGHQRGYGPVALLRPHCPPERCVSPNAVPPIDRPYVGLVSTSIGKGVGTFRKVMLFDKQRRYMAVRGGYDPQTLHAGKRGRLEVANPTMDMASIYAHMRVILMPSTAESWGRVAVEAGHNGIPVISTPTTGVKEAMGSAIIYADRRNPHEYVSALKALDIRHIYRACSDDARLRAASMTHSTLQDMGKLAVQLEDATSRTAA